MDFYRVRTPQEYHEIFYRQIGLSRYDKGGGNYSWEAPGTGCIHCFGRMDQILVSLGEYTVPCDFLVEYDYSLSLLHLGTIRKGTAYSVVKEQLFPISVPSSFLTLEKEPAGIVRWKCGQECLGTELLVDADYLQNTLLPLLGCAPDALSFLRENMRFLRLPEEMTRLLELCWQLLARSAMTGPLLLSLTLEMLALIMHPDHREYFSIGKNRAPEKIRIGSRSLSLGPSDVDKIVRAHALITANASSFPTIYSLAHALQLGEQKLKAGFQEIYQQTIWDYANSVRMNHAARLLLESAKSVSEIAQETGYQSTAAFSTMFRKWSGAAPGQFRTQTLASHTSAVPDV